MFVFRNCAVYAPESLGLKDIVVAGGQILHIGDCGAEFSALPFPVKEIDVGQRPTVPGFIDLHQHITGGGGELGFGSRVPELQLTDETQNGITTMIGLLGTDHLTRSLESLLAKAYSFRDLGLSAFILTGSYFYDMPMLTESTHRDLAFIEPVRGIKIAFGDHRGPSYQASDLLNLCKKAKVAALLSGKPLLFTVHMGYYQWGLDLVETLTGYADIQASSFVLTHINQHSRKDFARSFMQQGGWIDATCRNALVSDEQQDRRNAAEMLHFAYKEELMQQFTMSSDAGGSLPRWNSERTRVLGMDVGRPNSLLFELRLAHEGFQVPLAAALESLTSNPAKVLGLEQKKGRLQAGFDADIVVLSKDLAQVDYTMANGKVFVAEGKPVIKGLFEV